MSFYQQSTADNYLKLKALFFSEFGRHVIINLPNYRYILRNKLIALSLLTPSLNRQGLKSTCLFCTLFCSQKKVARNIEESIKVLSCRLVGRIWLSITRGSAIYVNWWVLKSHTFLQVNVIPHLKNQTYPRFI